MADLKDADLASRALGASIDSELTFPEAELALKELLLEVGVLNSLLRQGARTEGHGNGLAGGESAILEILDRHGPQSVPQMARLRSTSRQNIQVAVNRLASEQCVEFAVNPAHKRSRLVQITEAGRTRLAVARQQGRQRLLRLAGQFRAENLGSATALLRSVRLGFGGEQPPPTRLAAARSGKPLTSPAKIAAPQNPRPAVVSGWEQSNGELPVNLL
jgi:DNA-binding MarR family transcriptional regulator